MPRYLVTYHDGGMPDGAEAQRQAMADFVAWTQRVGKALVDPGAPLGPSRVVSTGSVTEEPVSSPIAGYSILDAADIAAAADLVRDHPFVGRGGRLQVIQALTP
ncbi:MAG: hypothetical protein WCB04_04865 [Mycobacteriales bacterium]